MLKELEDTAAKRGFFINIEKTKVYKGNPRVAIGNQLIENVSNYIYLVHTILLDKENQIIGINRRKCHRMAFWKLKNTRKNKNISMKLRTHLYDQRVLPVLTYGTQTWINTRKAPNNAEDYGETDNKSFFNISNKERTDQKHHKFKKWKWNFAGHVVQCQDERWTRAILM